MEQTPPPESPNCSAGPIEESERGGRSPIESALPFDFDLAIESPPPFVFDMPAKRPAEFSPRCLDCGYELEGLNDARCPECGRGFDPSNPRTFSLKPPLMLWRLWMPGFVLAIAGGFAGAIIIYWSGNWGWSLWFAVPFAVGSLIGYRVRVSVFLIVAFALLGVSLLCLGGAALGIAGFFCGIVLWILMLAPITVGASLGAALRVILKRTQFDQRWHLPALLLASIPIVCAAIEGKPKPTPIETVRTSLVMNGSADQCWDAIMFYEEVMHPPPFILTIGLARPLHTLGSSQNVGDIKTCMYNKGRITKQVTQLEHARLLQFAVIEQHIGYEQDVRLIGGSFEFEQLDPHRTLVTLTTTYEPLLRPRWSWRAAEHYAVHTLHHHVLQGMSMEVGSHTQTPHHVVARGRGD